MTEQRKLTNFTQTNTPYTPDGRSKIHQNLNQLILNQVRMALGTPIDDESMEYNDNRISKMAGQLGKCAITKEYLGNNFHCHHIKPKSRGGSDRYDNLVLLSPPSTPTNPRNKPRHHKEIPKPPITK